MKKKMWFDILMVLVIYAIVFAAVCFMWVGAEYVMEDTAGLGTVDVFFAAYFAWSMVRAMANVGKKVQAKLDGGNIQV